ncbi:DivIVA domain-containing protein [Desulfolucanica intricata]|uniref:DivIVA domain-containing protein n=1 Tax=Desulfolucanica intricata TaxID=1285191 RepID=UPI0009ED4AD5|nr:DivIVA domain-containing protein [Desulfolucanica intricata]
MLTPLDIHKKEFRRAFRGYNEEEVDVFLDRLAKDYEELYTTNLELKEQLEKSESTMSRYKELENAIKETLVMAQKNADELRQNTEKETRVMLQKAEVESERKTEQAQRQAEQMLRDAEQKSNQMIIEAESKVKEALKEYEYLCSQVNVFKIKFRSLLASQLQLLDGEPFDNLSRLTDRESAIKTEPLTETDEAAAAVDPEYQEVF